jgi:hypothetical protein
MTFFGVDIYIIVMEKGNGIEEDWWGSLKRRKCFAQAGKGFTQAEKGRHNLAPELEDPQ